MITVRIITAYSVSNYGIRSVVKTFDSDDSLMSYIENYNCSDRPGGRIIIDFEYVL